MQDNGGGMELKQGYKLTEVGVIPEDWESRPLSSIGRFKNGINKGSEAFGHGSPYVNLMDVFGVNSINKWGRKLKVRVSDYFLQRMKTKWGSCNHAARSIRLNTELVKKPRDLLEYVIVHEMAHLTEPRHSDRFIAILDENYPTWREARAELNELPLTAEVWKK